MSEGEMNRMTNMHLLLQSSTSSCNQARASGQPVLQTCLGGRLRLSNEPALDVLRTRGVAADVPCHQASLAKNGADLGVGSAGNELYGGAEGVLVEVLA